MGEPLQQLVLAEMRAIAEARDGTEHAFLQRILDFLRANVEVVPIYHLLDLTRDMQEGLSARVGILGRAVTVCAEEDNGVVVSDDQGMRQVAASRGQGTAWSADVLTALPGF